MWTYTNYTDLDDNKTVVIINFDDDDRSFSS